MFQSAHFSVQYLNGLVLSKALLHAGKREKERERERVRAREKERESTRTEVDFTQEEEGTKQKTKKFHQTIFDKKKEEKTEPSKRHDKQVLLSMAEIVRAGVDSTLRQKATRVWP